VSERPFHVRIYIAGRLEIDEDLIEEGQFQRHLELAVEAEEHDIKWLVEVIDPDGPPGRSTIRFGTDAGGMAEPIEVSMDELARFFDG
jgi:hypothetical protein